jgi:hypothetical protein
MLKNIISFKILQVNQKNQKNQIKIFVKLEKIKKIKIKFSSKKSGFQFVAYLLQASVTSGSQYI